MTDYYQPPQDWESVPIKRKARLARWPYLGCIFLLNLVSTAAELLTYIPALLMILAGLSLAQLYVVHLRENDIASGGAAWAEKYPLTILSAAAFAVMFFAIIAVEPTLTMIAFACSVPVGLILLFYPGLDNKEPNT